MHYYLTRPVPIEPRAGMLRWLGMCAASPLTDAPPRIEVGRRRPKRAARPQSSRMFMIALRSSRKRVAFFIGLVRRSARLLWVRTNGTSSSKASTMSRTK